MPLDISKFKLRTLSIEVRYAPAFLLWDKVGAIWSEMKNAFPEATLKSGEPNQQTVQLDDGLEGSTHIDKAALIASFPPKDMQQFRTAADVLYGTLIRSLKITDLSRIGIRHIYERTFETRELAANFLLTCQPTLGRSGKFFNVNGAKLVNPGMLLRWEGDTMGCFVNFHSADQRLDVSIPKEFSEVAPIKVNRHIAVVDVDYYAHASTPVSKFNATAIIQNWTKVVRQDLESFVNG